MRGGRREGRLWKASCRSSLVCICVWVGEVLFGGCGYAVGESGLLCELVMAFLLFWCVWCGGGLDEELCMEYVLGDRGHSCLIDNGVATTELGLLRIPTV